MVAKTSGYLSKSLRQRVPFPTPDGPEMTIGRRSEGAAGAGRRRSARLHFEGDDENVEKNETELHTASHGDLSEGRAVGLERGLLLCL